MRHPKTILFILLVAILGIQCANESKVEGTVIRGTIQNVANLQVFLDEVVIDKANQVLEKTDADANGQFELSFPEGLDAGIYRLRIGVQKINMVLNGDEDLITLQGDLTGLRTYDFTMTGSPSTQIYANTMQALMSRQMKADDVKMFIDTVSDPMLGMFVAYQALGRNGQFLDSHKKALERAEKEYANSENVTNYSLFISQTEAAYKQQMASERIQIGMPAPDIRLPNPDGKEYALSDLKGNVVLLDFWASWCGPCRRENPNVVKVYEKYKDEGFTVFSVSLDGLDSRTKARFNSQEQIDEQMQRSKDRWVQAIDQDGLPWEYHVSDLKKWECAPAREYGVRSIPRTFLIDREGNIAAINMRGAEAIERALQDVL
jgi:peroxiredoxin